ncbi:MAG: FHA domain-containing protein [Deltaproteobacteria bacterium]|nr:FHA domain-containing protein [Deltaproteobacteria bacterium]MBW2123175.1 FHA domain-containing protein [Deltaproteobacteria bacterium]
MARLEVRFNNVALRQVPLDKPSIMIGRSRRNDIVIDNMAVSRRHARIYQEGPRFIIQDLKSLNGTFVNNKRISEWILSHNDQILIGKHSLVFIEEEDEPLSQGAGSDGFSVEKTLILQTKKQEELLGKTQKAGGGGGQGGVRCSITVISGCSGPQEIELTKSVITAGTDRRADIRLKGLLVGRSAFHISRRPSGFYISSLGGVRTTRVNGNPVKGQQELKDGDVISVGGNSMRFHSKA